MPTVVKDELPRLITFPIGELMLRQKLGDALPEDTSGLYFLYLSGVQVNHYDPAVSKAESYPVLALDRRPPQLCADTLNRLAEQRRKKRELVDERLAGFARADAQLRGQDRPPEDRRLEELYEAGPALMLFPVKARLRRKVEDAILDGGIQPMRAWLMAPFEVHATQRPLVLIFHEGDGRVTAKFADPWTNRRESRIYR